MLVSRPGARSNAAAGRRRGGPTCGSGSSPERIADTLSLRPRPWAPTFFEISAGGLVPSSLARRPVRTRRPGALMNDLQLLENAQLRDDIPHFRAGDNVKVHVRVVEGGRE